MNYILQKDFDWFGKRISAGTKYIQYTPDEWIPSIDGAHCPHFKITFMTVKNNEQWFKPEPILVVNTKVYFGNVQDGRHYVHEFTTNHPIPVYLQDTIEKLIQEAINK